MASTTKLDQVLYLLLMLIPLGYLLLVISSIKLRRYKEPIRLEQRTIDLKPASRSLTWAICAHIGALALLGISHVIYFDSWPLSFHQGRTAALIAAAASVVVFGAAELLQAKASWQLFAMGPVRLDSSTQANRVAVVVALAGIVLLPVGAFMALICYLSSPLFHISL